MSGQSFGDRSRRRRVSDVFSDRIGESRIFAEALKSHRNYIDQPAADRAARNCLVFYGTGGVGKSSLSAQLESWARGEDSRYRLWGPPPVTEVATTTRVDLQPSQGQLDMVEMLLSVRRAAGRIKRRWPAFDLAFTAYLSSIRRSQELPDEQSPGGRFAREATDTAQEVLDAVGIPGTSLVTRSIRVVFEQSKRLRHRNYASSIDGFIDLRKRCQTLPELENPHPELLLELAALLDFELASAFDEAPLMVVFVDTCEKLRNDPRRIGEKSLNELIWSMPRVLFVITGRYKLDWYDEQRTGLFEVGPSAWPHLAPDATVEPRQHELTRMDVDDRTDFIGTVDQSFGLRLGDQVIAELSTASNGLPKFLEIALELAHTRKLNGMPSITLADVKGSLGDLVLRVLDDVPDDESRALRAAALFPYFDVDLISAAANVGGGSASRAASQPMIEERGTEAFPYSLHDEVRLALLSASPTLPGGWSDTDWRSAADRSMRALQRRHDDAKAVGDTAAVMSLIELAIVVACEREVTIDPPQQGKIYQDWLTKAIMNAPSIAGLRSHTPQTSSTAFGQGVIDFISTQTSDLTTEEKDRVLADLFRSDHPLAIIAGRHRGYALRNVDRFDDAITAFNDVVAVSPTELNKFNRVYTLASARSFQQAVAASAYLSEGHRQSVVNACDSAQGVLDQYLEGQRAKAQRASDSGRKRQEIEYLGSIYRTGLLVDQRFSADEVLKFYQETEAIAHFIGIRDALLAYFLASPDAFLAKPELGERLESVDRSRNDGQMGYRTGLYKAMVAFHSHDYGPLPQLCQEIEERQAPRSRLWIPAECLLTMMGFAVAEAPTEWTYPQSEVHDRWAAIFSNWIDRVG